MSKHRPFTNFLLNLTIFMILSTLCVLGQVIFALEFPLWLSFAIGTAIFYPISVFIGFRMMLHLERPMRMRRDDDYTPVEPKAKESK